MSHLSFFFSFFFFFISPRKYAINIPPSEILLFNTYAFYVRLGEKSFHFRQTSPIASTIPFRSLHVA